MFKHSNLNPIGNKVGDCVVRAIAAVTEKSWQEVYIELCIQGYLMSDLPSSNAVWGAYLKNKGFNREFIRDDCSNCYTIYDFAEEYPYGSYVVGTGTHATAVIDGIIYDAWDCGTEQPIYFYYRNEV